jgi:hypothetical protein
MPLATLPSESRWLHRIDTTAVGLTPAADSSESPPYLSADTHRHNNYHPDSEVASLCTISADESIHFRPEATMPKVLLGKYLVPIA